MWPHWLRIHPRLRLHSMYDTAHIDCIDFQIMVLYVKVMGNAASIGGQDCRQYLQSKI